MAILPGLDNYAYIHGFSDAEVKWLAVFTYLNLLAELLCLGWIIYNVWTFLYKQGKYKVLPLSTFYILATILMLVRIFAEI